MELLYYVANIATDAYARARKTTKALELFPVANGNYPFALNNVLYVAVLRDKTPDHQNCVFVQFHLALSYYFRLLRFRTSLHG